MLDKHVWHQSSYWSTIDFLCACQITSIISFLFPYLIYLIICNIIRMLKLVCLITSVKVQTKFVNHRNLEGNCIYIFTAVVSFNKTESTLIFNSHFRYKKKKKKKSGWIGCPLPNRTGREKLLLKWFRCECRH